MRGSGPSPSIQVRAPRRAALLTRCLLRIPFIQASQGGSSPGVGPQQTQNKHASPDPPPGLSLPNQSFETKANS